MFNRDNDDPVREQERLEGEGTVAGVPTEEHDDYQATEDYRATDEGAPAAPEQDTENTTPGGTVAVKYVGRGGAYRDTDGTRYKKGEPVEVSEEDAERLTSLRGSSIFVRADS